MKYRKVGNTGLKVSEIAFGSWLTFGNQVELDLARDLFRTAFDQGINYIDTADVYAIGEAEILTGEVLKDYNRRQFVIATKAFWPMSDHVNDQGLSRKHIIDSVHGSLERLKMDYVDIFYCHRFDPEVPLEETIWAVEDLIRQGKISYWGVSVWTAEQMVEAVQICRQRGWHLPIINQPPYSLLYRGIEKSELPSAAALGMGTAVFSPLAHGILTGKYSGGKIPEGSRGSNEELNMWMKEYLGDKELLARVDQLQPIADKYQVSMATLSLAYLLHSPGISSVIVGASSEKQLLDNCQASGLELDKEDLQTISGLFPIV